MRKVLFVLSILSYLLLTPIVSTKAQTLVTPPSASGNHGVTLTFVQGSAGTFPIAGNIAYFCSGTPTVCTATSGNWIQFNTLPINSTSILIPSANFTYNQSYSFMVESQDTQGNFSGPSNISTVLLPPSVPTDPTPDSNVSATQR